MQVALSHAAHALVDAVPSPDVVAKFVDPSLKGAVRLVRSLERGEGAMGPRPRVDRFEACDCPVRPRKYWEYLVVRDRANRDVRDFAAVIGRPEDPVRPELRLTPTGRGQETPASPTDDRRPAYAMPAIGGVSSGGRREAVTRIELAYRREVTLPTGNVIDVFA